MVTLKSGWWWTWRLHAQLVGDSHDYFEDRHEGGDLAEVAAADHLSVDLQTPLVVLAGHTATDLMESAQDVVRELRGSREIILCLQFLLYYVRKLWKIKFTVAVQVTKNGKSQVLYFLFSPTSSAW